MLKKTAFFAILMFVLLLTGCSSNTSETTIVEVVDGDTIKVNINGKIESVRFLLVDTPEMGKRPQPFAEEAKNFIEELLSEDTVILEKDNSDRDKYGRLLMYVYTSGGKSVQEELLKEGLARVAYVYAPNTKYVDKYDAIQKEAQNNDVGIWSIENYAQDDGFHMEVFATKQGGETRKASTSFSPDNNGNCNGKIKGNQGSNGWIYHVPDGAYYNNTKAEECFDTEQAAKKAGYRKTLR